MEMEKGKVELNLEDEKPIRPESSFSYYRNFSSTYRTFRCQICNRMVETNRPNQRKTCGGLSCVAAWTNKVTKEAQKRRLARERQKKMKKDNK